MEVIILCVTITSIMAIMLVGIGVSLARMDKDDCKRQCGADNHSNDMSDDRSRDRSSNDGCNQQMDAEEVINTIQTIRVGASQTEKEALDYACECIYIRDRLLKYINEVKNNVGKD